MTTTEPYLTLAQASQALGVKPYAMRRAIRRGDITAYRAFSNRWVVKVSEIEAAIRCAQARELGQ